MAEETKYEVPHVTAMAQPTSKTCWLACCRMVYKSAGQPIDQIEPKIKKALGATTYDSVIDSTGLLDEHLAKTAAALGFSGLTKKHLSDITNFWDYLKLSGALMCTGTFSFGKVSGLHAVVICGIDLKAKTLTMIDPYYQFSPSEVKKYPITHSALIAKLRDVPFSNLGFWVKPKPVTTP